MPSIGIIKLLKENNFTVIGTDIIKESAGNFFVDEFFKVTRTNSLEGHKVVDEYKRIVNSSGAKWIISGPENEVYLLTENESVFKKLECYLFHPTLETLEVITDKLKLIKYFKTFLPLKNSQLLDEVRIDEFESEKIVLKPRKGRGSNGIFIINKHDKNTEELITSLHSKDYLVQEYIKGKEYSVDVLCDLEGKLLNIVSRERIGVDSGISVISRTVKIKKLIEYTSEIVLRLKFRGISCIQFIEENGEYYLTDINPRIGGGSILAINSSATFKSNLINLLSFRQEKLKYNDFDFRELTMYRYYNEVYV